MLVKPGPYYIKNLLILLIIALILVISLPDQAQAAKGVITGSVVNVRSGPGSSYTIDGNLLKDTEVEVIESQNDWYKISKGSLVGWVSSSLLQVTQTEQVKVTGELVNLRSGPSTGYDRVAQASKGDILTLLGTSDEWYQVKSTDGKNCYVAAYLVEKFNQDSGSSSNNSSTGKVEITPVSSSQPPIVYLDNKKLSFEVDPVIEEGRTLVPLRAIFEEMGATVEWNNDTRTVTAVKGNTTVVLPIGSTRPTVNGVERSLDVPAKISQSRTLAPLRFVGEAFGGTVEWNGTTRTINITSKSGPASPVNTVVVSENKINLRSGPSTQYDAVSSALQGEKLAILAEKDGWYQVSRSGTTAWVAGWVVNVAWEEEQSNQTGNSPATPDPDPVDPGNISNDQMWISSTHNSDGIRIEMESTSIFKANIRESGNQIVYEIKNKTPIDNTGLSQSIGSGRLNLTMDTRIEGQTTVKITLPAGIKYYTASENGGKKEVLIIPNQIINIRHEVADSSGESVIIQTMSPAEFISTRSGDTVEVKLKSTAMGLEQTEYKYSDSTVLKQMSISQSGKLDPLTTLRIATQGVEDYRVFATKDDNSINIVLLGDAQSVIQEPRTNIVVLDAGHGGQDSGAIGFGIQEKDIDLAITLEVGEILQKQGVNVEYTRTDDSYLTLTQRAEFANDLNAALFVSIHNNSATNAEAHGTETYYYAPINDIDLLWQKEERSRLAENIQKQMVNTLGRRDRGVKQDNFTVLVKTKMPSALAEISFLSNSQENALLVTKTYQTKAAQAIANGILEYLGE